MMERELPERSPGGATSCLAEEGVSRMAGFLGSSVVLTRQREEKSGEKEGGREGERKGKEGKREIA